MNKQDDNLLEQISRQLPELKRSQRKVADFVLENPAAVTEMRLSDIAAKTGVSEPSVIRFCVSVGCSGYQDLKIALARSLAYGRATSHSAISPVDDVDDVIDKIFDFNLSSLNWVRSKLDHAQIVRAVDALAAARQIQFFGFGASAIAALDAQQKFPLFGKPCGAPADGHQMMIMAAMLQKGDVVVAISNTGATREILQSAQVARDRGAVVIGITGAPDTPLARRSDIVISVETLENTDLYTPTISRISAMVVIDILSTLSSLRLPKDHQTRIAEMKTLLSDIRNTGML
ncbi:MurR/RpiR family transcriptional regulator [Aliiroseovarius sediminis]|uniref:MurR/RpiR family transcriptional regulator n=1 Tax=Aliiroseovarius sediminis TaxID=2925839 RepID=UPI001F5A2F02|nr:MurR/RpiR family transcriptional regulator [uncultured Aliiroseovarius sp.]MCI2395049.1 MurR/RpiR family transcriptional regulator [Aliiroseovarius sediminis]